MSRTLTLKKKAAPAPSGPGKVKFQAKPWANVSVKGRTCTTGTPKCTMTLKSGRYTATFSQGGTTKRRSFRVKPGKTVRVFVDMKK